MRASHAKGICVKGNFTPTAEAAALSKSPVFAAPVPLVGRFSLGGGNPMASDGQKDNVRGIAMHFQLPDGGTSDLLMISAPIFSAKTPEQFLELLKTVATKDKEKIDAFFKANPDSAKQGAWLNARPTPASYATADYFGVHAFTLTNAKGDRQPIKWKAEPVGGFVGLSDAEAEGKGKDFYAGELNDRFAKGPVDFNLFAVIGQPGDQNDDPTSRWPADRKSVKMGVISITGLEPAESCDVGIFDPNNLADGVEPRRTTRSCRCARSTTRCRSAAAPTDALLRGGASSAPPCRPPRPRSPSGARRARSRRGSACSTAAFVLWKFWW